MQDPILIVGYDFALAGLILGIVGVVYFVGLIITIVATSH